MGTIKERMCNTTEKKIIIICTTDSMISNFLIPYIERFTQDGYYVECYCSETGPAFENLLRQGISVKKISFTRFPLSKGNLKGLLELRSSIQKFGAKMIFCHEPVGGFMGRIVGHQKKIPVVYMAHGFHFFRGAPRINWLLFYPVEKIASRLTDILITINLEDYYFSKRHMRAKKIEYLPGVGIDVHKFDYSDEQRYSVRNEFCLSDDDIAMISVGELNENKNHIVILEAMRRVSDNRLHYYIAGVGDKREFLLTKAHEYGLEKQVHLLGYRTDCDRLYSGMDIFCFPSYREGLSVALMEAMSCGLPVIASHIRGNVDLVNCQGGFLVDPCNVKGFEAAICALLNKELQQKMGDYNRKKIRDFSLKTVIPQFENCVKELLF